MFEHAGPNLELVPMESIAKKKNGPTILDQAISYILLRLKTVK